ncbi:hypothetical protein H4Q26_015081 [Puccinia striiformis f. sp. tritici PST-130]|nr:hypothetical protein H4Q26_015081 [Puccinia striiformis f. sp. tritici PST-130]
MTSLTAAAHGRLQLLFLHTTADDNNGEGLGNDDQNRSANTEEPPSTSQPTTPGTRESTDQEELRKLNQYLVYPNEFPADLVTLICLHIVRAQKIAANAQSDSYVNYYKPEHKHRGKILVIQQDKRLTSC